MISPAMSFICTQSQSSKIWSASSSLVYAFNLPPSGTSTHVLASSWKGNRVCPHRVAFISRNFNVATKRRKNFIASQNSDNANPSIASANRAESSVGEANDERKAHAIVTSNKSTPIWFFLVESAVQVTILVLAVAGSIHTRRRVLTYLVAALSVPQVILIANRIWRRMRSSPSALSESVDLSTGDPESLVAESKPMKETSTQELYGGELTTLQSKLISTGIRSAVAEEVGSLRYAIEQVEQTMEQRQQARNLAIAEAIASLDENLRGLRRSVDTRNQTEKSAPFALVSELEIVKSRLKQSEREKTELEVRLRAAEENFEEAKRQGERARREADEATSKELGLRTELAVNSSRLLRVEELTERLERAERMNDELQEQILNGTREQEGLRQSAKDAERRVVRVENIARILRDKVQELTGRPLPKYKQDDGDGLGETSEKTADQFWPQRLRGKGDLRPDSVVYQDLLREKSRSNSPLWPRDPLGVERERKEGGQRKKLPDDGGFGTGDPSPDGTVGDSGANKMLRSPEGGSDVMFSFSRGEFNKSSPDDARIQQLEEREELSQETREQLSKDQLSQSNATISPSLESSEDQLSPDDTISSDPDVEGAWIPSSSLPTVEDDQTEPSPLREALERGVENFQNEAPLTNEKVQSSENLEAATVQNNSSALTNDKIDRDLGGATSYGRRESDLEQTQNRARYHTADKSSQQLEKTPLESEVTPDAASISNDNVSIPENQQAVPVQSGESSSMQETSDQAGIAQRTSSNTQETVQPSITVNSDEIEQQAEQQTVPYLESLSRNTVTSVESTESLMQNARELVKKARVRGLAVKQADVLFTKATQKLERTLQELDDRNDRTEVEADLGGCFLAWAKTNIADPQASNRLSRALDLLQSSAESQPDDETILFNTGLCLCLLASTSTEEKALEYYKTACEMYERLLQANYNSRIACFNCGLAYVSLGRLSLGKDMHVKRHFERAVILFERSLVLKPGDSKAISYLDDCRRQLAGLE